MTTLSIYYRISAETKAAVRPSNFSKPRAFANFLRAVKEVPDSRLEVVHDSPEPLDDILSLVPQGTEVHRLGGLGNSACFRHAFELAIRGASNDLVYFVEDDYLHTTDSLAKLVGAAATVKADYFTLYDHPVRYATDYRFGLDLPTRNNGILVAADHHWRHQESTCMTFAGRVATLREDLELFWRYSSGATPQDRELFRRLQGLIGYEDGSPYRVLLGPIPSLATHCHEPWLAPARDWQNVLAETASGL